MALTSGTRLGPYEITAAIGAGGMGEVYRARDTTLDREVAIKVLPESFALDADRPRKAKESAKTRARKAKIHFARFRSFGKNIRSSALLADRRACDDAPLRLRVEARAIRSLLSGSAPRRRRG